MARKPKNRKEAGRQKPEFAAGDYDKLEEEASGEEIKEGRFTRVTRLSYDEVDPSRPHRP